MNSENLGKKTPLFFNSKYTPLVKHSECLARKKLALESTHTTISDNCVTDDNTQKHTFSTQLP